MTKSESGVVAPTELITVPRRPAILPVSEEFAVCKVVELSEDVPGFAARSAEIRPTSVAASATPGKPLIGSDAISSVSDR